MTRVRVLLMVCASVLVSTALAAQAPVETPPALTLDRAIQYAIDHYPTVRAALEQVTSSSADTDVARGAYLPRLDSLWQSNRGTVNNVFGQLLPQSVIPAMSGPVLSSASTQSVWGSATGAMFSWEPFDFGLRGAGVAGAEAALARARAGETLTRLEVASGVAVAFLNLVAAQRAVAAAQADVDRRDVLRRMVQTLVDNQLRPGADASRVAAERAAAQTHLIRAQQTVAVAEAILKRVMGVTIGSVTVASDALIDRMPDGDIAGGVADAHPLAQMHQAEVDQARAQEDILSRTDYPRFYLQSSVFARGSGANANGTLDGGVDGLGLDRANWAAGVQIVFPNVFDFGTLRARKTAASATTRAQAALRDDAVLSVTSEQQMAAAMLQAARAVAANTPIQLAAAQQNESLARARYDAGLTSLVEVADAESLLAQSEVQDQLARVDVWRALLAAAAAQGDLTAFVNMARQP